MFHVIGIDAGGSKTVCLLADENGTIVSRARGEGANLQSLGELQVEKVVHDVMDQAIGDRDIVPAAICVGIAGVDRPDDHAIIRGIMKRIGFKARIQIVNDALIALEAGTPGRPGVVIISGTGSIAYGRSPAGEAARSGGWGYVLGDEGSGYWIGVRAVRAALRAVDGRGPATALVDLVLRFFRVESLDDVVSGTYSASVDRSTLAALAPEVVSLDDDVARAIANQAVDELMTALIAVRRHCATGAGGFPVVLAGSLLDRGGALRPLLTRRLGEALSGARDVPAANPPAAGAARLAREAGASPH